MTAEHDRDYVTDWLSSDGRSHLFFRGAGAKFRDEWDHLLEAGEEPTSAANEILARVEEWAVEMEETEGDDPDPYFLDELEAEKIVAGYAVLASQIEHELDTDEACVNLDLAEGVLSYLFGWDIWNYQTDWGGTMLGREKEDDVRADFYLFVVGYLEETSKPMQREKPGHPSEILYPPTD